MFLGREKADQTGKPYAGNPHVWFDEGEVASCTVAIETEGRNSPSIAQGLPKLRRVSCRRQPEGSASGCAATPRRGSLLYKGWRECAADIFAKHGEIAAKMKPAPGPTDSLRLEYAYLMTCAWRHGRIAATTRSTPRNSPARRWPHKAKPTKSPQPFSPGLKGNPATSRRRSAQCSEGGGYAVHDPPAGSPQNPASISCLPSSFGRLRGRPVMKRMRASFTRARMHARSA